MTEPILTCTDVAVDYRTRAGVVHPLTGIDLAVPRRGLTLLAGPSGSGKSTLLRILGLLERPTTGTVTFDGQPVSTRSHRHLRALRRTDVALIFQNPIDNLLPDRTVTANLTAAARSAGQPNPDPRLLDRLGLPDTQRWRIGALSGGQQQRLAFGCALARRARVILADEPTSQLDTHSADRVIDVLTDLATTNEVSVIVATHDPRVLSLPGNRFDLTDGHLIDQQQVAS